MSNHFKTQQEIWKYVADGGSVTDGVNRVVRFVDGELSAPLFFDAYRYWKPYIEPVAKTKVWRWEMVRHEYIQQIRDYFTVEYATLHYPGYTKVPNSEREI